MLDLSTFSFVEIYLIFLKSHRLMSNRTRFIYWFTKGLTADRLCGLNNFNFTDQVFKEAFSHKFSRHCATFSNCSFIAPSQQTSKIMRFEVHEKEEGDLEKASRDIQVLTLRYIRVPLVD